METTRGAYLSDRFFRAELRGVIHDKTLENLIPPHRQLSRPGRTGRPRLYECAKAFRHELSEAEELLKDSFGPELEAKLAEERLSLSEHHPLLKLG